MVYVPGQGAKGAFLGGGVDFGFCSDINFVFIVSFSIRHKEGYQLTGDSMVLLLTILTGSQVISCPLI